VTERRHAEEQLHRLNESLDRRVRERTHELEQANEALEAFGYSVSHDLRAPLRTMQGFAEALLEDYSEALPPEARDYAMRINRGAERMDVIILDLLAYSRLSRTEIVLQPVELQGVVRDVADQLASPLQASSSTLEVESGLPPVVGHRATLVQIVSNLVSNALKFVAPGVAPVIRLSAERRDDRVRIFVKDNGIGIEPEHQARIFRVFERLHGSEAYPGTGIGLAIVKRGAERLGGSAGVEAVPNQGSCFWIELKAA
jgi:signal transduction histidine kinase